MDEIYNMLVKIHSDWSEKNLKVANKSKIQELHRKGQVNLLISFLESQKVDSPE